MLKSKRITFLIAVSLMLAGGTDSCSRNVPHADTESGTEFVTEQTNVTAVTTVTAASAATAAVTTTASKIEPPENLILKGRNTIEVWEELTVDDFIIEKNVELAEKDVVVDTTSLGSHEINVKYKSGEAEFEKKLSYTVVDTTAPMLLNGGWSPIHIRGKDFDLNDYVGFADNFDPHPALTYEGRVDVSKNGDYPLKATVTDSSGNVTSWDVTITVADSKPVVADTNQRVQFSDFTAKNSGE